jgi:hypothetical protein
MAVCGAGNPDHPEADYACEYPAGHERIWRYGAWQDHGAPSVPVFWVVPPYGEDEVGAVSFVIERARANPQIEALLLTELAALGWAVERIERPGGPSTDPYTPRFDLDDAATDEFAALRYGVHAPLPDPHPDRPEYHAVGYTVIEPRKL